MQKLDLTPDGHSNSAVADLLRSGRDALANDVLRHLPKSEAEFRALVARQPVLMSAVAAAAGGVAMQLVLTALRREPRTALETPAGHRWLGVATALWPFVRRTGSPAQAADGAGLDERDRDDAPDGVRDDVRDDAPDLGPQSGTPEGRWHVGDLWHRALGVNRSVLAASETAKAKARDAARLADDVSDAVVEQVATAAKSQPVLTLVAAAVAGFAVTWLCARR